MKREAYYHPKMLHFASLLGVDHAKAVGTMQLLLNWAGDYATQGNIGKHANGTIARACLWEGDPDHLVESLTESGWLDRDRVHRLMIHDWAHHCENWVRAKLKKQHLDFIEPTGWDSEAPESALNSTLEASYDGSQVDSPTSYDDSYEASQVGSSDTSEPSSCAPVTKPNQSKPSQTKVRADREVDLPDSVNTPEVREAWAKWIAHRKARRGPKLTELAIAEQMTFLASIGPERAVAAIAHSIRNNYQGIFEPRVGPAARASPQPASREAAKRKADEMLGRTR